jgi:DNA/RNA endonuclease G (NUC1)
MRIRIGRATLVALAFAVGSCSDNGVANPARLRPFGGPSLDLAASAADALPDVRFSEIHYDNSGTDTGEAIEISGPAGTDLRAYSIVLYNGGNDGASYNTQVLSGIIPSMCDGRGVVVFAYPTNGIQNGPSDGMALIGPSGLVEFLSYEGTLTVDGVESTDIGVSEAGNEAGTPPILSLQRDRFNVWTGPKENTFGACNPEPPLPADVAAITISPETATLVQGAKQSFAPTAFDVDGQPITGVTLTWSSTDPAIATVTATGVATGVLPGDVEIRATAPNGVSGSASLHVDEAPPPPSGAVYISELHYDNDGTDTGEAIEIEGPAGLNLASWKVVLYNGSGGASYDSQDLSGTITDICTGRGVVVVRYPTNGVQNGSPDGVALVNSSNQVVEFLSYEGTFTASGGPASGLISKDIGVSEVASTPIGQSLQRNTVDGPWRAPAASSFGDCNGSPLVPGIVINELMADPLHATGGASWGEWFEVHNSSTQPIDLQGWTIASGGGSSQPPHVISASVVVPAGGYAVLGRGNDPAQNGGITLDYNYFSGNTTIFLDATDWLALRNGSGATVDSVRWANSNTMAQGVTRALRSASVNNSNVDGDNWGYSTVPFGDGDFGTPRAVNGTLSTIPPGAPNRIGFSGRLASDPALPVGFEDQLFATLRSGGVIVPTTFTWSSETPTIASIDQNGVMHALATGTATFRATAQDGTTATFPLPTTVATASTTAQYANNTEFGEPIDGDATDDFIIRRAQYTTSYNKNRNTPNWVSYNLEATHIGSAVDRCDCFTHDPLLPTSLAHLTTADYTGAGAAAGFGIDRGHLARSFDRTAGTLDNATTYYFSNIIPQAADNNQGPWAILENHLGDLARNSNKEVYIIAGVAGAKGTVKNEGKIMIPANVWKVAVIMPHNQGLANVDSYDDLEVVAVVMPNDPGVRNVNWETYKTTVDAVETLSGYDLLALLPDRIEVAVESDLKPALLFVDQLITSGNVTRGDGKWLTNKLELAVAHLAKGLPIPAVNQLEDVLKRLDALVNSGALSAADAEMLRTLVRGVIRSVSS